MDWVLQGTLLKERAPPSEGQTGGACPLIVQAVESQMSHEMAITARNGRGVLGHCSTSGDERQRERERRGVGAALEGEVGKKGMQISGSEE